MSKGALWAISTSSPMKSNISGSTSAQVGPSATSDGLIPCTLMLNSEKCEKGSGGMKTATKSSTTLPSRTFTKPTAQGLAAELFAVSKSIAVKFRDTSQLSTPPRILLALQSLITTLGEMQLGNQLSVVASLLQAMAESRDANELCTMLGTKVLVDYDVAATYLAILAPDGRITMVGSWGYPPERRDPADRPSLWYPMSITDAIRLGQIKVHATWDSYLSDYPHLRHRAGPGKSYVSVPFTNNQGQRTGGLGLTFNSELVETPEHQELWPVIAQAGDLFINKSWAGAIFKPSAIDVAEMNAEQLEELRHSFSERDLEVIRLTVGGGTVESIAKQLRYSESTIKQTRIAVYKRLGVKRVVDLALAAANLGLL